MSLPKLPAAGLLVIFLPACGPGGKPPAGGLGGGTPQVSVVTLQPQQVTLSTQLPGRTSAIRVAEIRPQVNGLIQKRLFTEGAQVRTGDMLYQIDPAPFQAALDNARAALADEGALNVHVLRHQWRRGRRPAGADFRPSCCSSPH